MPDMSVIVCTYNRCESLRDTLKALQNQTVKDGLRLEIIVVDNNSNDFTADVVAEEAARSPWPIRYLFEPNQGKSYALNRGIHSVQSNFIAFCDDDTVADSNWLQELHQAFSIYDADVVGGPVRPLWSRKPPEWLEDPARQFGPLAILDRGNKPLIAGEADRVSGNFLIGSNFAVRSSVFREVGFYRTDLGRAGKTLGGGEDSEMVKRLLAKGKKLVYIPTAIVNHKIPVERMTLSYLRRWNFWMARSTARMSEFGRVTKGVLFQDCFNSIFVALSYYLMAAPAKAVGAEINFWWKLGMFVELWSRGHCEDSPRSLAEPKQSLAPEIASLPLVARNDKKGEPCQPSA